MDDDKFQLEAEKLFVQERRRKAQSFPHSLREARAHIMESFYDHIVSIDSDIDRDPFEVLSEDSDQPKQSQVERDRNLSWLIQKDIEKQGELAEGEILVQGEGVYVAYSGDTGEKRVEVLLEDFKLHGEANRAIVTPLELCEDEELYVRYVKGEDVVTIPGLWLILKHAALYDGAGMEVETYDNVMVPLNLPTLDFDKVMRIDTELAERERAIEKKETDEKPDIIALVTSEAFQELCLAIENDLNYNTYTTEERASIRGQYTEEIADFLRTLEDFNDEIPLSAADAINVLTKEKRDIIAEKALYNGFRIIECDEKWRVVQTFSMVDVQKRGFEMFHIFPENIQKTQEN